MASTFLALTNKILGPFNEVQLTSTTFALAQGFQLECQNYINQAIFDICTTEDAKWPFLWSTTTFNTVTGQTDYTRSDVYSAVDWQSFRIERFKPAVQSITANLTTSIATITTVNPHLLITGDIVSIYGATDTGYNVNGAITVLTPTTFTIPCTATTTPATGTLLLFSENVLQTTLQIIGWNQYIDSRYWDTDQNTDPTGYGLPKFIVRKPDNSLYIGQPCNRPYTVYYEGYTLPPALVAYSDTSLIPTDFEQVIVDKAMHYAYMFRDNADEAALAEKRYEDNVFKMRRILIPQETFAVASD